VAGELLASLRRSRHAACALALRRGDRLEPWARRLGVPLLTLPPALLAPCRVMRETLSGDAWDRRPALRRWLAAFRATTPDVGLVYCGGWVPPRLAGAPRLGFVNFHPAPLPELPGYFAEYLLSAWGATRARGAFHLVSERFDRGPLLGHTPLVRLPRPALPGEINARVVRGGLKPLEALLDRLAGGRRAGPPPGRLSGREGYPPGPVWAGLDAVNRETRIDWGADGHDALLRRLRAFGGVPRERCHPLHADVGGTERTVLDLDLHRGVFPGRPGDAVGRYRGGGPFAGAALVRTREGVAVVAAGPPFRPGQTLRRAPEWLVGPGRSRRRASREAFAWNPGTDA